MDKETPNVGGVGPIVVGVLPKQPRRVVLEARTLAEELGAPLVFAYVEINSYLVEWELKEDIRGNSLHPKEIDEDMTEDARDILRILDSAMAGSKISWSFRVLAGDPGKALARLGSELHARMIVVGTRHQGVGARLSELLNGTTAHRVIAHQTLPVVVVPVHHEPH
ncbi:universal stress protein [Arthrobacter sp. AQ5-05]|uniref:universal stress protein n=1 Tax=Arthrobacter sp. AQ5-05 TaxID=2184581 RepID=UPI0015EB88AA|nr:universal stress protein [Arthrobacter sp. AQ5-05]